MFRSKTLFVLGAGSSHEVNLPTGDVLKNTIAEKLNILFPDGYRQSSGDVQIMNAIQTHVRNRAGGFHGDPNPYLEKAWLLRDALPQAISIDNLLDAHRDDGMVEFCGKLGIVKSILEAEQASLLYSDVHERKIRFDTVTQTWFSGFFRILTENVSKVELPEIFKNVSFLNFNYDRCVEQYLYNAIQSYYGISSAETVTLLSSLKIARPYGSVGLLPWQSSNYFQSVPFGADSSNILEISKGIKTFNEKIQNEQEVAELRSLVQEAEIVVFLGFAFHRQNLQLMKPGGKCRAKRIYATAFGISNSDCEIISQEIVDLLMQGNETASIEINNAIKCGVLFKEYWRGLTS